MAVALLFAMRCAIPATGAPPNVILIMADDLGVEGLSCYGSESCATPNLDALAAEGVRFTQCHAQPLCTPSRVKLMTGRSNIRNYSAFSILEPDEPTIGQHFKSAGYATAVAGKWQLLGADHYAELAGTGTHPRDAGFDTWCLWQVERLGSRYWGPLIDHDGTLVQHTDDRYGPDLFTDFIRDFIRSHRDEPFFVYYPMALVHNPFVPAPDSAGPNPHEARGNPRHLPDMVAHVDTVVGRIVRTLDETGLRDDTIVIFTCDNGTNRNITSRANGRDVRGGKGRTTDAGTHVPLIVSCPPLVPAGRTCDDLVDLSDFLPTLADACDLELPADLTIDGRSFWAQLRGETGEPREWLFCYYNPRPGRKGFPERCFARDKRWKLYRSGELFDLEADTEENSPFTATTPEAAAAKAKLQAALDSMPAEPARIQRSTDGP
jgi:arylsulfatase A